MDNNTRGEVPDQRSVFEQDDELDNHERDLLQQGIGRARSSLFLVGALMFVVDMVILYSQRENTDASTMYATIAIDAFILLVFIGLGLYTKRKPFAAILAGLLFFCLIQLWGIINDPSNIYKGIFIKVAVIVTLVTGLKKAKAIQNMDRYRYPS